MVRYNTIKIIPKTAFVKLEAKKITVSLDRYTV